MFDKNKSYCEKIIKNLKINKYCNATIFIFKKIGDN